MTRRFSNRNRTNNRKNNRDDTVRARRNGDQA